VTIVISTVIGAFRGFVREILGIISVIVSAGLAIFFLPVLLGPLADRMGVAAYPVAFIVLFVGSMIAFSLLGKFIHGFVKLLKLSSVNRFFGGLFGLARSAIFVVLILSMAVLLFRPRDPVLISSRVLRVAAPAVKWVGARMPGRIGEEFHKRWVMIEEAGGGRFVVRVERPYDS